MYAPAQSLWPALRRELLRRLLSFMPRIYFIVLPMGSLHGALHESAGIGVNAILYLMGAWVVGCRGCR
jgi:hypothetical protein